MVTWSEQSAWHCTVHILYKFVNIPVQGELNDPIPLVQPAQFHLAGTMSCSGPGRTYSEEHCSW